MNIRTHLYKCLACMAIVSLTVSCKQKTKISQHQVLELTVQKVKPVNREINEMFAAIIRGKQDIDIRPQVSGFITKVKVDEGDVVHKGQILFIIDQVQYQEAVNVAKANIEVAKANVETAALTEKNKKDLAAKNVISAYDYQLAKNELERSKSFLAQAKAQLVSAEKNLSYTSVASPTDGIVGRIPFWVGALVSPSMVEAMTTVSEYSEMYAYFSMTEKKLLEMSHNKTDEEDICDMFPAVKLQLADGSLYSKPGIVKTISGMIDETTGSVNVRALFPNENKLLRSGGTGVLIIPHTIDSCLVIPQSATYEIQDQKFVYQLGDSSVVHTTQIETYPIDNGQEYIVTKGLTPGDLIVTEGISSLHDGMSIRPKTK